MKKFPIMHGGGVTSIPWDLIAPHETRAGLNHRQTLEHLANRGGLSPCEAVAVLEDRRWHKMDADAARARLLELAEKGASGEQGETSQGETVKGGHDGLCARVSDQRADSSATDDIRGVADRPCDATAETVVALTDPRVARLQALCLTTFGGYEWRQVEAWHEQWLAFAANQRDEAPEPLDSQLVAFLAQDVKYYRDLVRALDDDS